MSQESSAFAPPSSSDDNAPSYHLDCSILFTNLCRQPDQLSEGAESLINSHVSINNLSGMTLLIAAVARGNIRLVETLIKARADVNFSSQRQETPLHYAALIGDISIAQILMDAKAQPQLKNDKGNTPLICATQGAIQEVLQCLLTYPSVRASVDEPGYLGRTALHVAAQEGDVEAMAKLLDAKANPDSRNNHQDTPLMLAASAAHVEAVDLLLQRGANVNASNELGHTPLHYARGKNTEIEGSLIKAKAHIHAKDKVGNTPLQHVLCQEAGDAAGQPLSQRPPLPHIDKPSSDGHTLHNYVKEGNTAKVKELLAAKANLTVENALGMNALHIAIFSKNTEIAEILLKAKAPVDSCDKEGCSLLSAAALFGRQKMVQLLLKHAALRVPAVDIAKSVAKATRENALHLAACGGDLLVPNPSIPIAAYKQIMADLLEAKVDINAKDAMEQTPLIVAANHGKLDLVEFLLKRKAALDRENILDESALHIAVKAEHLGVISALLKAKANPKAMDSLGVTALQLATQSKNPQILPLFFPKADIKTQPAVSSTGPTTPVAGIPATAAPSTTSKKKKKKTKPTADSSPITQAASLAAKPFISADLDKSDGNFLKTVKTGTPAQVAALLTARANMAALDLGGNTPLMVAVLAENDAVVDHLLKHKASLTVINQRGQLPLHLAALKASKLLDKFLSSDAVNVKDEGGNTPLMLAAKSKSSSLANVEKLIRAKAKPELKNDEELTAVQLAQDPNIIKYLKTQTPTPTAVADKKRDSQKSAQQPVAAAAPKAVKIIASPAQSIAAAAVLSSLTSARERQPNASTTSNWQIKEPSVPSSPLPPAVKIPPLPATTAQTKPPLTSARRSTIASPASPAPKMRVPSGNITNPTSLLSPQPAAKVLPAVKQAGAESLVANPTTSLVSKSDPKTVVLPKRTNNSSSLHPLPQPPKASTSPPILSASKLSASAPPEKSVTTSPVLVAAATNTGAAAGASASLAISLDKPLASSLVEKPVTASPGAVAADALQSSSRTPLANKPSPLTEKPAATSPAPKIATPTTLISTPLEPAASSSPASALMPAKPAVTSDVKRSAPPGLTAQSLETTPEKTTRKVTKKVAAARRELSDIQQFAQSVFDIPRKEWTALETGVFQAMSLNSGEARGQLARLFNAVIGNDPQTVDTFIQQAIPGSEIGNMFRGLWQGLPLLEYSMLCGAWNVTMLLLKHAVPLRLPLGYRHSSGHTAFTLALWLWRAEICHKVIIDLFIQASQDFQKNRLVFPGKDGAVSLVNISGKKGMAPLMLALKWAGKGPNADILAIVEALFVAKADISATSPYIKDKPGEICHQAKPATAFYPGFYHSGMGAQLPASGLMSASSNTPVFSVPEIPTASATTSPPKPALTATALQLGIAQQWKDRSTGTVKTQAVQSTQESIPLFQNPS